MQAGLLVGQTIPQPPQFIASVPLVIVQVPLQFVLPWAGHGSAHWPFMQAGIAVGQATPQSPQFFASALRFTQLPPQSALPWDAQTSGG
jgi:hypothetical protein